MSAVLKPIGDPRPLVQPLVQPLGQPLAQPLGPGAAKPLMVFDEVGLQFGAARVIYKLSFSMRRDDQPITGTARDVAIVFQGDADGSALKLTKGRCSQAAAAAAWLHGQPEPSMPTRACSPPS